MLSLVLILGCLLIYLLYGIRKRFSYRKAMEWRWNASKRNSPDLYLNIFACVAGKFAPLLPLLGIVLEIVILCIVIYVYERNRARKKAERERKEAAENQWVEIFSSAILCNICVLHWNCEDWESDTDWNRYGSKQIWIDVQGWFLKQRMEQIKLGVIQLDFENNK